MDREIIWLKAFVLTAFVFLVLFHGCLSKPATKINTECSGHRKVFMANGQLLCIEYKHKILLYS